MVQIDLFENYLYRSGRLEIVQLYANYLFQIGILQTI